ncbi:MAG: hypothetical protein NT121_17345 [Chloroflexi bacterium]|nr:hypothetical protein [Chloroflexota bacterium]
MPTLNYVILLGNSIYIVGLALSLAAYPDIVVTIVDHGDAACEAALISHPASVVIYEVSVEAPASTSRILHQYPDLILIGIDPSSKFVRGPSGEMVMILTMQELTDIIRSNRFPSAPL